MNVEEFYDDPRRRGQPEVAFGNDYLDDNGTRWRIAWIPSTGEVYAMAEPELAEANRWWYPKLRSDDLVVWVLATIDDEKKVRDLLGVTVAGASARGGFEAAIDHLAQAGWAPPWKPE